jgi:hypothetical protein
MSIRNALEGVLHGGELGSLGMTDEQMRILNPIVRNALATALHARTNYHWHRPARAYLDFQAGLVPDYWEPAEYVEGWDALQARDDGYEATCRRCGRAIVQPTLGRCTHLAAGGTLVAGCRAASFTSGDGWDDALDRRWRAAPS